MNRFFSRLTPVTLVGAILTLAGIIIMMNGLVRAVRTTRITPLSEQPSLSIGSYVSGDARDVLYGTPESNGMVAEHSRPIEFETYSPLSIDPLVFYTGYLFEVSGKLCPLFISSRSELSEQVKAKNRTEPLPFTGVITKKHCENFKSHVTSIYPKFYHEIDGNTNFLFTEADCAEFGIRVVDIQKERITFLWGLPFLVIGLFLLWREGVFRRIPEIHNDGADL
jgi:hypothetical protein